MKAKAPSGSGLGDSPTHGGRAPPAPSRSASAPPRRAVPCAPGPSRSAGTPRHRGRDGGGRVPQRRSVPRRAVTAPRPPRGRGPVPPSRRCPCLRPRAGRCGGRGRAGGRAGSVSPRLSPPPCLSPRRGRAGLLPEVSAHQRLGDVSSAPLARGVFGQITQRGSARSSESLASFSTATPARSSACAGARWPCLDEGEPTAPPCCRALRSHLTKLRGFIIAAPLPWALGMSACVKATFVSHQLVSN